MNESDYTKYLGFSGAEIVRRERNEQIEKHGFNLKHDRLNNSEHELLAGAESVLAKTDATWPSKWDKKWWDKIQKKDRVGQLAVAGALYFAEEDRLGEPGKHSKALEKIVEVIDKLLKGGMENE